MRQILRIIVGLLILCALALVVFLIINRRGVPLEQHPQPSPPPQQAPQSPPPQQSSPPPPAPQSQQSPPPPQRFPQALPIQSVEPSPAQDPQQSHARAVEDVRAIAALLEDYMNRNGAVPTTAQGLTVIGEARKDPWGNPYIYESPSTRNRESYDLFSAGPDHQPDTPDDDWGEMEVPGE